MEGVTPRGTTAAAAETSANGGCGCMATDSPATIAISRTERVLFSLSLHDANAHPVAARLAIEHPCCALQQEGRERFAVNPAAHEQATMAIRKAATALRTKRILVQDENSATTFVITRTGLPLRVAAANFQERMVFQWRSHRLRRGNVRESRAAAVGCTGSPNQTTTLPRKHGARRLSRSRSPRWHSSEH